MSVLSCEHADKEHRRSVARARERVWPERVESAVPDVQAGEQYTKTEMPVCPLLKLRRSLRFLLGCFWFSRSRDFRTKVLTGPIRHSCIILIFQFGLSLLNPDADVHLAEHIGRGNKMLAGMLGFAGPVKKPTDSEAAVSDSRTHPLRLRDCQGLPIHSFPACGIEAVGVLPNRQAAAAHVL